MVTIFIYNKPKYPRGKNLIIVAFLHIQINGYVNKVKQDQDTFAMYDLDIRWPDFIEHFIINSKKEKVPALVFSCCR